MAEELKVWAVDKNHASNFLLERFLSMVASEVDLTTFLTPAGLKEKLDLLEESDHPEIIFLDFTTYDLVPNALKDDVRSIREKGIMCKIFILAVIIDSRISEVGNELNLPVFKKPLNAGDIKQIFYEVTGAQYSFIEDIDLTQG